MPRPRIYIPCLIFLLLTGKLCFSQEINSFTITWNAPKNILNKEGLEIKSLSFDKAIFREETYFLPTAVIIIPGYVSDIRIFNEQSEGLTEDELKVLYQLKPVSLPPPEIEILWQNGKPVSHVYYVPLAGIHSNPSKITSFNYTYQTSSYTISNKAPKIKVESKKGHKISAFGTSSVLSSGIWYKIRVNKSGIFKIDYNFLNSIGVNPNSIDPREIKIYGNGGGMLPQDNSIARYDDLVENAIFISGENDGIFNTNDFILFYAQGPDTWHYNTPRSRFQHIKNIYSDYTYYFLTIGSGNGLRIQDQPDAGPASQTITTFDERIFHENDLNNIVSSGREWFGENFDYTTNRSFSFNLPGITPNSTLKLFSYVMASSLSPSSFTVSVNGNTLGTQSLAAVSSYHLSIRGRIDSTEFSLNTNSISGSTVNVTLNYNKGAYYGAVGYLNYLILNVPRDLKLYGNQTSFRSVASTSQAVSEFIVGNASGAMLIWDITDPLNPKNQLYSLSGSNASFTANTATLKEFIAFSGSNFDLPAFVGIVPNQNLHSIDSPNLPDLVIVTHPLFLSSANRLAQFRETNDNLQVEVVTTEQVYNEFSSGTQDITAIRDFMKMLYDRKAGNDSVRYLLLFGDASYDYKNRVTPNTNYVPIYESRQSLHPIDSYSSDDYFGFLDNTEGTWSEPFGNHYMDIGVGRLPVKNITEADAVVSKIINYSTSANALGKWRNKICFVADDGDNNLHLNDADYLSNIIRINHKEYNIDKIFLDAYPQNSTPGGENCPVVNDAITQSVEKGTFILNYTGHGGEIGWAQEAILTISQINGWNNYQKLPLVITATCEFGRYDDPGEVSGGEHLILHSSGGASTLITSTRPVYSNSNKQLNEAIYNCIFQPINGEMPRMGDIMRITKNTSLSGVNNRNYALLGDPSMRLAYPQEKMVITKINGNPVSATDTIKALGTVTIEGEVRNEMGVKLNDFNGTSYITIFDKESIIQTLGTQGASKTTFTLRNNLIYEGTASIINGNFSVTFVVPKDISYQFDKGKVSLYGIKEGTLIDANGQYSDFIVGGTDSNYIPDNTPPLVKLFMNDESFVFGGLTPANSLLIAKLSDDNGINIAGQGIGHDITAVLDNSVDPIILNEYYSAKKDNYKEGSVEFPFKDLSPGLHSVKFKCWDTHNNSGESYLEFIVAEDAKIALDHVLNYPNPFSTHTTFHFDHNRAGDDIDVLIQIYTVSGKLIKTLENTQYSSKSHFADITWDGKDDFGDKIGKGVYVYKVNIRSQRDGSRVFKYQKLVILN